ncbi:ubiquinone/menaquinone biosynthesis C-methylase UbiE [Bacillus mesophilus]|uniref:Methyltransferase domain-containing protein n=1 Tax=Bacillus mesophilus TaxID=1808955 RepID=A0A6M0QB44_9BACI|nr:methyltransferase domain-containing protein [Bacillus mesophilus]MBM7663105.1 ubiquinone/menaquinone biosynthesis C-methylase UbiE [Bacillus mesophilus]NEY73576.1 methyltransferase domain-containing protein [Bacillus mesophilus]
MENKIDVNPFLEVDLPRAWGPATFDMALPLVDALNIKPGMRILEVGGGSGQIATTLAKHWDVSVVTLEPWAESNEIQLYAASQGVENKVLQLKIKAQNLPFADHSFDAIFSIGSFEMIGDERPKALSEMIRVAKPGASIGIAEPMCLPVEMPSELVDLDREFKLGFQECFSTLEWNENLFINQGLAIKESYYFKEAYQWWLKYRDQGLISEAEQTLITKDKGQWISLGLVVGKKKA